MINPNSSWIGFRVPKSLCTSPGHHSVDSFRVPRCQAHDPRSLRSIFLETGPVKTDRRFSEAKKDMYIIYIDTLRSLRYFVNDAWNFCFYVQTGRGWQRCPLRLQETAETLRWSCQARSLRRKLASFGILWHELACGTVLERLGFRA